MTQRDPLYDERLSAMYDGEEPLDETGLASDPASAEVFRQWRGLGDALRGLPTYRLPDDFARQVWTSANVAQPAGREQPNRTLTWRIVAGLLATTAAGFLLLLAWAPWSGGDRPTEQANQPPEARQHPAASPEGGAEFVGAKTPLPAATQYLLVVDVTLTQRGVRQQAFDQALAQVGIPFDASIGLDRQLEEVLTKSRFLFKPAARADATKTKTARQQVGKVVDLVYVVAPARKIDSVIPLMKQQPDWFKQVRLDLATKPEQLKVFEQLRRASKAVLAGKVRPARAQRVALPPAWLEFRESTGRLPIGLIPSWTRPLLGITAPDRVVSTSSSELSKQQRQAKRIAELAQSEAEALFVLKVDRTGEGR